MKKASKSLQRDLLGLLSFIWKTHLEQDSPLAAGAVLRPLCALECRNNRERSWALEALLIQLKTCQQPLLHHSTYPCSVAPLLFWPAEVFSKCSSLQCIQATAEHDRCGMQVP